MSEMIRTFICIDLPEQVKSQIAELQAELKKASRGSISWVKPANIHLTLRFLGDVAAERQAELRACVERIAAQYAPFPLAVGSTGVFPNTRNPRVFWVGVKGSTEQLLPLQKGLETELRAAGFGKEDKPFSPHITIGRARQGGAREVSEALDRTSFPDTALPVEEIIVMRSDLKPTGPIYSKLAVVKLSK